MSAEPAGGEAGVRLRLFVAGRSPNSTRALKNLTTFCERRLRERYTLEVVDILDQPARALEDGVMLTPTLLVLSASPTLRLVGNLKDGSSLEQLLAP